MNVIVGLEGGVGSGKSTTAKLLNKSNFNLVPEFMTYLDSSLHHVIGDWSPEFRLRFFSDVEKARKEILSEEVPNVLDRTFLSIFAHDYAQRKMGKKVDLKPYQFLDINHIICPTHIILMKIDNNERLNRITTRSYLPPKYILNDSFNRYIQDFIRVVGNNLNFYEVDSDKFDTNVVSKMILQFLTNRKPDCSKKKLFEVAMEVLHYG